MRFRELLITNHIPVMLQEVVEYLNIDSSGVYVDATLGTGGHSHAILNKLTTGTLYSFDQDIKAIQQCRQRFINYQNICLINKNFSYLYDELLARKVTTINGIVFDLGLSLLQINDNTRGFSYLRNDVLDMRMNCNNPITAQYILNHYSLEDLQKIFQNYGEEPKSRMIAKEIIKNRPLYMTFDLVKITDKFKNFRNNRGHSAKRVFQALRIEVNQELKCLKLALEQSLKLLKKGGIILVISFNSLEDRLVKYFFKQNSSYDSVFSNLPIHDKDLPIPVLRIINKKVIRPSAREQEFNSCSHSAKLRVAIKNI
ncbi:16S rRNA (cytosine(1402)-N(4))-methyltransferase RsmH [Candidatus Phytoplasma fabacearum]|uniref:Ribosomal RNA small subunit methyltransferase H n=1 Tax=Candidatus Phytoplasma fabacearum TaxID=2982628 RepID=A0ABU8ZSH4_9MOLU|nr:16S rRNA (cytosine(1402)-N(4))-methyltransferase RsmH ['Bituminaria bituminosa' little leaf phytoplasma]